MGDRIDESLRSLARERPTAGVGNRPGNHDREAHAPLVEHRLGGENRGLAVEDVEDGLDQQEIDAAFDQPRRRLAVRGGQRVEIGVPEPRIVDVGRDRGGPVGGTENARDEARPLGRERGLGVGGLPRDPGGCEIEIVDRVLHQIVRHRDGGRVEGVGLDDVRADGEIRRVDIADDVGPGQRQEVVIALLRRRVVGEAGAPIVRLGETIILDHRAHGAVEHEDAGGQRPLQRGDAVRPGALAGPLFQRVGADLACHRRRSARRTRLGRRIARRLTQAEDAGDRVGQVRPVEGIEVELVHAVRLQRPALLGGDGGGDQFPGFGILVEPVEEIPPSSPVPSRRTSR